MSNSDVSIGDAWEAATDKTGGLTTVAALEQMWSQATSPIPNKTVQPDQVYLMVTDLFQLCRARREEVDKRDPWRQGALLVWAERNWEQLTSRGYVTDGQSFTSWAEEQTGVKHKTWAQWKRVVNVLIESSVGKAYLAQVNLTPDNLSGSVTMDKAARATRLIARGRLQHHQLEALVNPEITSDGFRHALNRTEAEVRQAEQDFVANGDGHNHVVFESNTRCVLLYKAGEAKPEVVLRFERTADPVVKELQDEVVESLGAEAR